MSDSANSDLESKEVDNGAADAVAATALITLVILGVIHLIYTGGLSAFVARLF